MPAVAALRPQSICTNVVPRVLRAVWLGGTEVAAGRLTIERAQEWSCVVARERNTCPELCVRSKDPRDDGRTCLVGWLDEDSAAERAGVQRGMSQLKRRTVYIPQLRAEARSTVRAGACTARRREYASSSTN